MPKMTYELMDIASAFLHLLSKERLLSLFRSALSLLVFCTFFSFILQILFEKNGAKTERQSLLLSCFSFFFLFYCLPSRPHSNTSEGKKLPLISAFFFLPTACLFFVFFFSFFFFPSHPFFFSPSLH